MPILAQYHDGKERLNALTGLRFLAAAAIVLLHSAGNFGFKEGAFKPWGLGQAVSFFFVLWGFVLAYAYPKLAGGHSVRNFYVARIARIWPTHIAAFFLVLILLPSYSWTIPSEDRGLVALAASRPDTREVQFGRRVVLLGMGFRQEQDGLVAELIWESLVDQDLTYMNAIHMVDKQGVILAQADYPQDYAKGHVSRGTRLKDVVTISEKKLKGAEALGIAVYDLQSGSLLIDRGPRDWDNHRLVLKLG